MEDKKEKEAKIGLKHKLLNIQMGLAVPKGQRNEYGGYFFRSKEDILECLKPVLKVNNLLLTISDNLYTEEGWHYVTAVVTLEDLETKETIKAEAYAREPIQQRGMTEAQITGTAASYAQKWALSNLFLIDDGTKDADAVSDGSHASTALVGRCAHCGTEYSFKDKEQFEQWAKSATCCEVPQWSLK